MKYYAIRAYRAFKGGQPVEHPRERLFIYGASDGYARDEIDAKLIQPHYYSYPHPDAVPMEGECADVFLRMYIATLKKWTVPETVITGIRPIEGETYFIAETWTGGGNKDL